MREGPGIALAVRVRNEWSLVRGLLDHVGDLCDEAWILDDASEVSPPSDLGRSVKRVVLIRARNWSGAAGRLGEGLQRDHLLQRIKRASTCGWILQLDADERLANPAALRQLTAESEVDGWVMPLVDFYITPDDAEHIDEAAPDRVRRWFGIETRWTLTLFRTLRRIYVSRGDVREPQGLAGNRVRETAVGRIDHYGKAMSIAEWERKVDFYAAHYPEYREKWLSRRGAAVHHGVSDFGTALVRRDDPAFDPWTAPVLHRYRVERGSRNIAKQLFLGILGDSVRRLPVADAVEQR